MKRLLAIALFSSLSASAEEGLRSGHATAQWLVPVGEAQAGKGYKTVVRLRVDDPWHVYWYNPGEAGMPTSVEMKMPEGWESSGLLHPIPKRFKTGGLHGFGHEGTVDYLLKLYPPDGFAGDADLEAKVSWLTCNDDACIPGEIVLKMKLVDFKWQGPDVMKAEEWKFVAPLFPVDAPKDLKFRISDEKNQWELVIENPELLDMNIGRTKVYIETQELVPATAELEFHREAEFWVARVPKGEYAPEKPEQCAILLVQEGKRAVRVEWNR